MMNINEIEMEMEIFDGIENDIRVEQEKRECEILAQIEKEIYREMKLDYMTNPIDAQNKYNFKVGNGIEGYSK